MSHQGLISLILSAILVLPVSVSAQDRKTPTIGFLTSGSTTSLNKDWIAAFKRGLGESGYVDGENVKIEYRGAEDQYNQLDGLVAEFVRDQVAVIIAAGGFCAGCKKGDRDHPDRLHDNLGSCEERAC